MKKHECSTILETIERKIEGIQPGSAVRLSEIIGTNKEKEIVTATKLLLRKYGIELCTNGESARK